MISKHHWKSKWAYVHKYAHCISIRIKFCPPLDMFRSWSSELDFSSSLLYINYQLESTRPILSKNTQISRICLFIKLEIREIDYKIPYIVSHFYFNICTSYISKLKSSLFSQIDMTTKRDGFIKFSTNNFFHSFCI